MSQSLPTDLPRLQAFQSALEQLRALGACLSCATQQLRTSPATSSSLGAAGSLLQDTLHQTESVLGFQSQAGANAASPELPMHGDSTQHAVLAGLESRLHGAMQALEELLAQSKQQQQLPEPNVSLPEKSHSRKRSVQAGTSSMPMAANASEQPTGSIPPTRDVHGQLATDVGRASYVNFSDQHEQSATDVSRATHDDISNQHISNQQTSRQAEVMLADGQGTCWPAWQHAPRSAPLCTEAAQLWTGAPCQDHQKSDGRLIGQQEIFEPGSPPTTLLAPPSRHDDSSPVSGHTNESSAAAVSDTSRMFATTAHQQNISAAVAPDTSQVFSCAAPEQNDSSLQHADNMAKAVTDGKTGPSHMDPCQPLSTGACDGPSYAACGLEQEEAPLHQGRVSLQHLRKLLDSCKPDKEPAEGHRLGARPES